MKGFQKMKEDFCLSEEVRGRVFFDFSWLQILTFTFNYDVIDSVEIIFLIRYQEVELYCFCILSQLLHIMENKSI